MEHSKEINMSLLFTHTDGETLTVCEDHLAFSLSLMKIRKLQSTDLVKNAADA